MRKILFGLLACITMATIWYGCSKDKETSGSIYGVVTDKATGEPIKTAGVELQPIGLKTVTGSDGTFEFANLEVGDYNLYVTKTGYLDCKSSTITIKSGQQAPGNVQMEKAPHALRVVNSESQDISSLDFGDQEDDISRTFVVFNDGPETIEWEITITAQWLHVSKQSGSLNPGKQQSIIATIDRNLLMGGENMTTLHVTSNDGSKELTVKATGVSPIITLAVTETTPTSAVLNGKLTRLGDPVYTEMGFVYGTMPTPSISNGATKISIANVQLGVFSEAVSNLTEGNTYYVRAYATNANGTTYGNQVVANMKYLTLPSFEHNGHTYRVAPDPHTSPNQYISWESANAYCENLTLYEYSDWRMPTIEELETMYANRNVIGGFVNPDRVNNVNIYSYYHSSTSYDSQIHYQLEWITGERSHNYYLETRGYYDWSISNYDCCHVRPIRVEN